MSISEFKRTNKVTSLEIATLKGKRHESVKQIIHRLVAQKQIPVPVKEFCQIRDKIGRLRSVYVYAFYGDSADLLETIFLPTVILAIKKTGYFWPENIKTFAGSPTTSQKIVLPPVYPSAVRTMSSREIAELTGKAHSHVMRDIRTMMAALEQSPDLDSVCKSTTYTGSNGQSYDQYELDKDTCLTLLLGYDPVARMKVVKRWQALEALVAQQPTTSHGQPLSLSQMFAMFSAQFGKIEQDLQCQANQIKILNAALKRHYSASRQT